VADAEQFDVIVHGRNCWCNMGAGIAKNIKRKFPEAFLAEKNPRVSNKKKLGAISTNDSGEVIVVNAGTQFNYSRNNGKNKFSYRALKKCMQQIKKRFSGKSIGMPRIGTGLGGAIGTKLLNLSPRRTPSVGVQTRQQRSTRDNTTWLLTPH
jgi:O-acetyl-ADP-ribose deacetylase (regulator of RNase III)